MISQNNHPRGTHGSALVVTILLVSVMLTAALILLQRIIPYAKNVRSMHDAVQSYYTARGEIEAARFGFFYDAPNELYALHLPTLFQLLAASIYSPRLTRPTSARIPVQWSDPRQTVTPDGKTILLRLPNLADPTREHRDYVVSSANPNIPLQIKLFKTDNNPRYYGTSKVDAAFHTLLSKSSGWIRFDLRGVPTASTDLFALAIKFRAAPPLGTKLTIKMQYADSGTTPLAKTFSQTIGSAIDSIGANPMLTTVLANGAIQTIDSNGDVTAEYGKSLVDFLSSPGCVLATICSLTLTLEGTPSVDFQLISTPPASPIPDLNAVVVGDGLSDNGLYFQRVIDLIPTKQDI